MSKQPSTRIVIADDHPLFRGALRQTLAELAPQVPNLLKGGEKDRLRRRVASFVADGVPEDLARDAAGLLDSYSLLDIVDLATETGRAPSDVAPLYYLVSEQFGIDAMLVKVTGLPREDRWDALARS